VKALPALLASATIVLAAAPRPARADEVATGVVVQVDTREIFVNLGTRRGVAAGAPLRLKHPIALRHPVTRQPVADWLPIGSATVTSAGEQLSMAVLDPDLRARVRVGDIAEIYVERDEVPPPAPPPAPDDRPLPVPDPDTAAVLDIWASLAGRPLDVRIASWEGWLSSHAASPHAAAVREDLDALRAEREALAPQPPTRGLAAVHLDHAAPTLAERGRALPLVFVVDDPDAVASAWLHYRTAGAATYHRLLLTRDGALYLRGTIPAAAVADPGVEYFVEAIAPLGGSGAALATPAEPIAVAVPAPPLVDEFTATRRRTRLTLATTYLDFATFDRRPGDRTDRFALTEADVLYRLGGVLWGVRAGFGSYGGYGGYADRAWTPAAPAPAHGLQYGYAEAVLHAPPPLPPLGGSLRLVAGVGERGFALGVEARARLGAPDGANLSAGFSHLEAIGFFSDIRLETWPAHGLPVGVSVGVTDQPSRGDLGVRLGLDLGWRALPWLIPTVKVSWQGRTVEHAGAGAGLGLVFDW